MVRPPSIDSNGMKKGAWSEDEDNKLRAYILRYGHWNWRLLPKYAGLKRCGKSCRLRWVNYLKPGVKRGNFTKEEQELVIKLHRELGNKWSAIAEKLPGRTDNEIKNFWHTRVEKRRKPASQQKAAKPVSSKETGTETETDSSSSEVTSLSPFDANSSQDELDLMMSHIFEAEAEFDYPELRYSELSCSGSSYVDNWAAEGDVAGRGSFWNDRSSSNSESESSGSYVSPAAAAEEVLLDYFGFESLLW